MAQSRGELMNALVDDITRTALRSANLSPEDRVLAGERVRMAVRGDALGAHGDVVAASHGDPDAAEAEAFEGYVHGDREYRVEQDPESPARQLAAELVASDDRINKMDPARTARAQEYIAHAAAFAAQAEAGQAQGGPSQAPAAARGAAAVAGPSGPAPAAGAETGPVAAPVVAVAAGVHATKSRSAADRRGPSIG
ncbi:MAG TPA: hypothetical protein VFH76_03630 [Kribbella sp.]|nr:hypothetical protein [Kribbella sp.]